MTSTQLPLGVDPAVHERALALVAELTEQVADEIAAGERQAAIVLELWRLVEQVCPECRAIISEAMRGEVA